MNVLAPMAWTALAVFNHDKANKIPTINQLGYQQKFMDGKILLPGGSGKFALNLFPVKPESELHKILAIGLKTFAAVAPVLNLPAISIPVLKTITEICLGPTDAPHYGKPLLNSLPVRWAATQRAFEESLEIEKYPLVDGIYVMVPQAHTPDVSKSMTNTTVQQALLVDKDASKNDSPMTRALQAMPGVTYVTLSLKATKVPQGGLPKSAAVDNNIEIQPETGGKKGSSQTGASPRPTAGASPKPTPSASPRPSPSPTQTPSPTKKP
jgi:hypothetical protein